jgi:hypothetical protein
VQVVLQVLAPGLPVLVTLVALAGPVVLAGAKRPVERRKLALLRLKTYTTCWQSGLRPEQQTNQSYQKICGRKWAQEI